MRNIERTEHGTRAELTAELRRMATGWDHLGKEHLAVEAALGARDLESGQVSDVQVGHTRYQVTD